MVTTSNFDRRSAIEYVMGRSTRPSTVRVHASASISAGGMPLLRMKWRAVGVIASSRRCGGVSALTGRSLRRVSPSLPTSTFSSANAAGMSPAGMLRWNGIAAPTIAAMVASPAPRRKPRRSEPDSRPKKARSAAIGSFAKNSWRS